MRFTRKTVAIVAILAIGVVVGVIADRTYWFGLRRRSLSIKDCDGVAVVSPYTAWWMTMSKDGSAALSQGRGVGAGGFGFSPILTMAMTAPGERCHLPAGTFDFSATCRELLSDRRPTQTFASEYEESLYHVMFRPTEAVAKERADPVARSRIIFDELDGYIDHAIGTRLLEAFRKSAQHRGVWPKNFEEAWPYPPIPWAQNLGVPKNLKVVIQN